MPPKPVQEASTPKGRRPAAKMAALRGSGSAKEPGPTPEPVIAQRSAAPPGRAAAARPKEGAPPSTSAAIVVNELQKAYPNGTRALKGLSFSVRPGEFYGILGPNGAGKSTLIGILGTLVRPTGGKATVLGTDVTAAPKVVKRKIGFAMQEAGVDELATGIEFLVLQGRLQGLDRATARARASELLTLFGLEEFASQRIKNYSGGMKRRVDLASALIHRPPVLFLDEPTEGLDPRSRMTMWALLKQLNRELKTTVLLSTHYMEEADRLCDRIAIIDQGQIVVEGTPEQLKGSVGGDSLLLEYAAETDAAVLGRAGAAVAKVKGVQRGVQGGSSLTVYVKDARAASADLLRVLDQAGVPPATVSMRRPTLDDVYLKYTGRTIATADAAPTAVPSSGAR